MPRDRDRAAVRGSANRERKAPRRPERAGLDTQRGERVHERRQRPRAQLRVAVEDVLGGAEGERREHEPRRRA